MHRNTLSAATTLACLFFLGSSTPGNTALLFTEDFSSGSQPAQFELSPGGVNPSYDGSTVRFNGTANSHRKFLRTIDDDYNTVSFVAEVTVTMFSGRRDPAIAFFGFGRGEPQTFGEPRALPHIFMGVRPDSFFPGQFAFDNEVFSGGTVGPGGDGTHRLRMEWNATTQLMSMSLDEDYSGGPFVADITIGPIDGSDNGFNTSNSRIFFGGNNNIRFDDFEVRSAVAAVPEPATMTIWLALIGAGALGFGRKRRRSR